MSEQTSTAPPGSALWVWEIVRIIPYPQDEKKHMRCSMLIAAETIEQVWDYIAVDRADAATEIESIVRGGALVAILPNVKLCEEGGK